MPASLTGMIIMIIYSAWALHLRQGPVLNHARPDAGVTGPALHGIEAERTRVVIDSSLDGEVQIPQTSIFVFFLLLPVFQRRPATLLVS